MSRSKVGSLFNLLRRWLWEPTLCMYSRSVALCHDQKSAPILFTKEMIINPLAPLAILSGQYAVCHDQKSARYSIYYRSFWKPTLRMYSRSVALCDVQKSACYSIYYRRWSWKPTSRIYSRSVALYHSQKSALYAIYYTKWRWSWLGTCTLSVLLQGLFWIFLFYNCLPVLIFFFANRLTEVCIRNIHSRRVTVCHGLFAIPLWPPSPSRNSKRTIRNATAVQRWSPSPTHILDDSYIITGKLSNGRSRCALNRFPDSWAVACDRRCDGKGRGGCWEGGCWGGGFFTRSSRNSGLG